MTKALRIYLAIVLAMMLAPTGQSMAVARGMPGASGQMVICTGSGPVMISVDANGQPVGAAHICPEAALGLIQTAFDSPAPAAHKAASSVRLVALVPLAKAGRFTVAAQARAPPASA